MTDLYVEAFVFECSVHTRTIANDDAVGNAARVRGTRRGTGGTLPPSRVGKIVLAPAAALRGHPYPCDSRAVEGHQQLVLAATE